MSSYHKKCPKPIPIGLQEFAYQCENISMEPIHGAIQIRAWPPHNGGKHPYPNSEKDLISCYDLRISRFTGNSIELTLTKNFKDKSEVVYTTNTSFAHLVNILFEGEPANIYEHEPPVNNLPSPPSNDKP